MFPDSKAWEHKWVRKVAITVSVMNEECLSYQIFEAIDNQLSVCCTLIHTHSTHYTVLSSLYHSFMPQYISGNLVALTNCNCLLWKAAGIIYLESNTDGWRRWYEVWGYIRQGTGDKLRVLYETCRGNGAAQDSTMWPYQLFPLCSWGLSQAQWLCSLWEMQVSAIET